MFNYLFCIEVGKNLFYSWKRSNLLVFYAGMVLLSVFITRYMKRNLEIYVFLRCCSFVGELKYVK